ncbi:MAG: ribonuclease Z, partial [Lachnospiraceae bacterium]|nr:ribonuclease Z [Lachnospiraceae bacterium]
ISGLPGMLLSMANADRTEPVVMIGPRGLEYVVSHLRVIAPELPFALVFEEMDEPEVDFVLSGYHIHAFRVNHNVTCYGYVIEIPRAGKFDADAAKRLEIPLKCWNPLQKGQTVTAEGKTYTPDMVMGPDRRGIKVAYVTDTRPTKGIVEAVYGADLFVCEGMYGDREKAVDAKKKKHMTFYEAARMAADAQVGEMWLTHFSPSMVGPDRYMNEVKSIFNNAKLGKDGKSKTIAFVDEEET